MYFTARASILREKLFDFLCIQIVPTEYRYLKGETMNTNQFSVTEYFTPLKNYDRSWPGWFVQKNQVYLFT